MDFKKGQVIQAVDELGRWEEARIVDVLEENEMFYVNFIGWSSQFNLLLKKQEVRETIDPYYMSGHGRGVKRGLDSASSAQLHLLKQLTKGDEVKFTDGDVVREGQVILVDRFNRTIDVAVDEQSKRIAVHHLKPEGIAEEVQSDRPSRGRKKKIKKIKLSAKPAMGVIVRARQVMLYKNANLGKTLK